MLLQLRGNLNETRFFSNLDLLKLNLSTYSLERTYSVLDRVDNMTMLFARLPHFRINYWENESFKLQIFTDIYICSLKLYLYL